jgi:UDP-GlcNAc:undecaprenyl-phosphate GlcNAc-1-phosphate transferase
MAGRENSGRPFLLMVYAIAFVLTLAAVVLLARYAPKLGLIDEPNSHREHHGPTPLVGGIAMFIGLGCGWLWAGAPLSLLFACFLLVACGIWDDVHELSSSVRFFFQAVACTITIYWGGVVLADLSYLFRSGDLILLGRWAVALTIFGTVGVINAINMSDGMDGLAGCLTLLSTGCMIILAIAGGMTQSAVELGVFVSVVTAFLLFNLRFSNNTPARVFMGDAGSMLLGFVLAWYLIKHTQDPDKLFPPAIALWLVALPLFDAVGVLIRRTLKGHSPFKADRMHYHHYLLAMGLSVNKTLVVIILTTLAFTAIGLVGYYSGVPEHILFYSFLTLFLFYLLFMEGLERKINGPETQ